MSPAPHKILLIVAGSVAAFKASALASSLTKAGYVVRTVLTESAQHFVGAATFEGLTREAVYTSAFTAGEAHSHLTLSQWADLTLVYPATANLIAKWSIGVGDDLASLIHLAHQGTIWIAPAMNPRMWAHPATREATAKMNARGVRFLSPDSGRMACGEVGEGRLVEPDAVLAEVTEFFRPRNPAEVLVTAGGTREPIDAVRSISNTSSGETGVRIAEALARAGYRVTLLQSETSRSADVAQVKSVRFDTFEDFEMRFREELGTQKFRALVHAAAVSDYRVESPSGGKISSDAALSLRLVPRPKLVTEAKAISGDTLPHLISFKLTVDDDVFRPEKYVTSDVIIQNRLSEVRDEQHRTQVFRRSVTGEWRAEAQLSSKTELCDWIVGSIREAAAHVEIREEVTK